MTDGTTEDIDVAGLVAIVDGRRSEGLSVAAACRAAGVSTSTYYRRRRLANPVTTALEEAEAAGAAALVSQKVAPDWPFADATPRAPLFWDRAFADEMADSFVRRHFGARDVHTRARCPVTGEVSAAGPRLALAIARAGRTWRRVSRPFSVLAGPLLAIALIALLVITAGWMVSVAADPAAWLSHPAPTEVATAAGPLSR